MLRFNSRVLIPLLAALGTTPALAEAGNLAQLTLAPGFDRVTAKVSGYTAGAYSLLLIAKRDGNDNPCIGYGAPSPDHVMVLEKDFPRLKLRVNSRGEDTTLVIQGPDNDTIRCSDDTGNNKDASISDTNWEAGTYKIWVGSFDPNQRWDYTLSAVEAPRAASR